MAQYDLTHGPQGHLSIRKIRCNDCLDLAIKRRGGILTFRYMEHALRQLRQIGSPVIAWRESPNHPTGRFFTTRRPPALPAGG